jgi:competence protein ComEC
VTRAWVLPAAACSFAAGVLLLGERLGPHLALGSVLLGVVLLGLGLLSGSRTRDHAVLEGAGLVAEKRSLGPRERILRAAGIALGPSAGGELASEGRRSGRVPLVALATGVAFFLLGAGWTAVRQTRPELPAWVWGRTARFHATAATDIRPLDFGWSLEVSAERIELDGLRLEADFRASVLGNEESPPVEVGETLVVTGVARAVDPRQSPFEAYLDRRGVSVRITAEELEVRGPPSAPLLAANVVRRVFRSGVERAIPPREGGLLLGLAVGDLSRFDPEVEEDFRATGLGHLVAVSGSNVVMFLAPILGVSVLLRLSAGVRFAVGVVAVLFFVLLTRWEPSVLRATVMAVIALAGILAGRPRSTIAALGAAVLLLLIADPSLAWSLAFQLSAAATAGIVAFASPIASRLSWLPRPLALTAAATLGAQLAVTPILLVAFGVVPTVALLANLLAFPAVPIALALGLAAAGVAIVWPWLGGAVGMGAALPLGYLAGVADHLARAPFPTLTASGILIPLLVALAVLVASWRVRSRNPRRRRRWLAAAMLAAILLWAAPGGAGFPAVLTVTFLDVGQGDAAVVRGPDGGTILIDSGGDEQLVARKLAALGIKRIDLAVATHAHADHVGGFPAVFSRHPVGLLLEPGCPAESPAYDDFLRSVDAEDVTVLHPRGGDRLRVGSVVLEVLGPDECTGEPNDDSIVLNLELEQATVLFTGDAEVSSQEDMLADGDPIHAIVLKVPHHGGATSAEEFLAAVGAEVAVVSVGENDYGHPVDWVLELLQASGARVLRTDLLGDITVRFAPRGLLVESTRG